ncbi:putative sulfoacetate transporter SauU [Gimesia fumaroli]|uniref:Putative sulfoacetate transporter SauU n=1 Tax=Gimesia fumaroli TaxID=2527976 RepID=A0A518IB54_9PLAN|nr:putative sulfoacetate transporter SauU [Gimesia fumaroli]
MVESEEGSESEQAAPTHARFMVLTLLCLVAAVAYISRNAISVPAKLIQEELDISLTQMGWVMSAFFWSYALSQIPSGWIGHVWGTRRSLTTFALLWSIATILTGLVTGFWMLIAVRLIFGISQAGIFPCCASTISKWLPKARRGLASGLLGSFMSIGSAFGAFSIGLLMEGIHFGGIQLPGVTWRTIMFLCAVPSFVWAVCFYYWFRDRPENHRGVNDAELKIIRSGDVVEPTVQGQDEHGEPTPWGKILTSFSMWMICGQQFFRAAGSIFYMTWFPVYLQKARGITIASSGIWTSFPLMSFVVGNFLGGVVVDWVLQRTGSRRWSRQGVAITAMLGCGLCTLCAYFVKEMNLAMTLITISMFFAGLGGACGYTVTIDKGGQHVAPIFGMMNMAGNLGAALLPVIVGTMFDAGKYDTVLILMAGIYVTAALCWMLLNPNGTVFDEGSAEEKA